ncbi:hypothetical protein FZC83_01745 [Rossellomorea marisflavi]|uniref:Uncharacterized protein n=2 Tax=Rossellomorea marisflavi TaxID=189381 RepID=A0A5D4S2D3_9BACI|nr:hypothetical protein FZC83_01745 [Rossellomorea marisflavi]
MNIKEFTYQNELINEVRKGKTVVGNWARGAGKTFSLARVLFEVKPRKVLYFSDSSRGIWELGERIGELLSSDEDLKNSLSSYNISSNKIDFKFYTGETVVVLPGKNSEGIRNVDYVFFDNIFDEKLSYIGSQYVLVTTQNNHNKNLQHAHRCKVIDVDIFDLVVDKIYGKDFVREVMSNESFFKEWGILNEFKSRDSLSVNDFKEEASRKLMKQFLDTPYTKDTVLTRKNIIEMLKDLKQI